VNRRLLTFGCLIVALAFLAPAGWAQEEPPVVEERDLLEQIKKPVPWFEWGADLRLRQTYMENQIDLNHRADDVRHFFRIRTRVWSRLGPFLTDDALKVPNGVSAYARLTHEARVWIQRQNQEAGNVDEIVLDNAYIDLQRLGGMPVSVRVGRQDMIYGRGWIILDGTPLDGSRTIYNDAIKVTLHLDEAKSSLDLFAMNNKGRQSRVEPLNDQNARVSDYDAKVFGAYLKSKLNAAHEANVYYIYKDADRVGAAAALPYRNGRVVHTSGGLLQGKVADDWDYYGEAAYQWGKEGNVSRSAWGMNSDVGYTLRGVVAQPRIHAGYEYLSGDKQHTGTFEGWDPVLSRWPQWSELYVFRWAAEGGLPGAYTNLQRFNLGASAKPIPKMCLSADYNYVLANAHTFGRATPYASGDSRGQHLCGKLTYTFNKFISGHLWAEYFHPESYYNDVTDDALFLRWQLMFKL